MTTQDTSLDAVVAVVCLTAFRWFGVAPPWKCALARARMVGPPAPLVAAVSPEPSPSLAPQRGVPMPPPPGRALMPSVGSPLSPTTCRTSQAGLALTRKDIHHVAKRSTGFVLA